MAKTETQHLQEYTDEIYGKGFYIIEYEAFKGFYAVSQRDDIPPHSQLLGPSAAHAHAHLDEMHDLMMEQVITLAEAAEIFGLNYQTLRSAVREERIDARQSGATWLTTRAAIKKAVSQRKLRS